MIKERISVSGDLKSKVNQLMEYAGWQEGRKVDISIAEQYYAAHGVPMMKTTQRFYRKYFGLCCQWYLEQKKMNWAADFEFALFPYLVNGIKNHLEDAYFRDMTGDRLAKSNKWQVSVVSPSDISATVILQKSGFRSMESYMRNMSIRMKLSVFLMYLL